MSKNKRICVLGYDALEIELVEKFDFPNLKQAEYGKTDISDFDKIATPILWGSFLTGENLSPYFVEKQGSNFLRHILRKPYEILKKHVSAKLTRNTEDFLRDAGILAEVSGKIKKLNVVNDLNKKTIFDFTEDSVGINIPAYNPCREPGFTMKEKLEDKISSSDYWDGVWDCFEESKRELLRNLDRDLVMSWFRPADWIGHIWRGEDERMKETYRILNDLAGQVRDEFDGVVLIVADHGMERLGKYGDHSRLNYGYYSVNKELGLRVPKIPDFYGILKDIFYGNFDGKKYSSGDIEEVESEEFEGEDEEEIKRRLKDLGYFD